MIQQLFAKIISFYTSFSRRNQGYPQQLLPQVFYNLLKKEVAVSFIYTHRWIKKEWQLMNESLASKGIQKQERG